MCTQNLTNIIFKFVWPNNIAWSITNAFINANKNTMGIWIPDIQITEQLKKWCDTLPSTTQLPGKMMIWIANTFCHNHNSGQKVPATYLNGGLKSRPFNHQTSMHLLKYLIVRNLDPHCSFQLQLLGWLSDIKIVQLLGLNNFRL